MELRPIPMSKLSVDLTNFRIGEFDTPREAYQAMIDEEGVALVQLATDIVEHGLSPADPLIVGENPERKGEFVVFEGNRRVTAIKLMQKPALASGTPLHKSFEKLSKQHALHPIRSATAVVMKDKDAALLWIKRKHTTHAGRGISGWSAEAQARFEAYQGAYRPSKAIIDHLTRDKVLTKALAAGLKTRTTNVDRVFQMPYAKTRLGIVTQPDGSVTFANSDTKAGNALLLKVLTALAGMTVDKIKSAEQRRDFIDQFAEDSVANDDADFDDNDSNSSTAKKPAKKVAKKAKSMAERTSLAPTTREHTIRVSEDRLKKMYRECRELNADKFPQLASILMRVFLELSAEHYLTLLKITPVGKFKNQPWSTYGISAVDKVKAVLNDLDPSGKAADLKNARRGVSDPNWMHSIHELHAFIHDLKAGVVGSEARTRWDRWHPLFSRIYERLNAPGI